MRTIETLDGLIWSGQPVEPKKPVNGLGDMPLPWSESYRDWLWDNAELIEGRNYVEAYHISQCVSGKTGFILSAKELELMGKDLVDQRYQHTLATSSFKISGFDRAKCHFPNLLATPVVIETHGLQYEIQHESEKRDQLFVDYILTGRSHGKAYAVKSIDKNNIITTINQEQEDKRIIVEARHYDATLPEDKGMFPPRKIWHKLFYTLPVESAPNPILYWRGKFFMKEHDSRDTRFLVIRGRN